MLISAPHHLHHSFIIDAHLSMIILLLYTPSGEEAQRYNRGGHILAPVGGNVPPIIAATASVADSSGGRL